MKQVVCKKDELSPGQMMSARFGRIEIVVCRTPDGSYYAYANTCLHQGAPMSAGALCGTTAFTNRHGEYRYCREGEILRCPWHGREYDVTNQGRLLAEPNRRLRSFTVQVEGDDVVVYS